MPIILLRAVGRSENPGVPVLFGGNNLPPLVEIGLTDLPKSGGAPPGTTGLKTKTKTKPVQNILRYSCLKSLLS